MKKVSLFYIILISIFIIIGCKNSSKARENTKTDQSIVMLKLFNIKTSNDLMVKVPESNTSCIITEISDRDSLYTIKGYYTEGEERGVVDIDYKKIVALNQSSKNETSFVIPFSVSNQGSEIFKYIGLFSLNTKDGAIKHIDSKFLGDRIKLKSIKHNKKMNVQVKMKVHSEEQSMHQTPTETKEMDFNIDEGKFKNNFD